MTLTIFSVSPFLLNIQYISVFGGKGSGLMMQVANLEVFKYNWKYKYYICFNRSNKMFITKYVNFPIKESTCMECNNCLMKE